MVLVLSSMTIKTFLLVFEPILKGVLLEDTTRLFQTAPLFRYQQTLILRLIFDVTDKKKSLGAMSKEDGRYYSIVFNVGTYVLPILISTIYIFIISHPDADLLILFFFIVKIFHD